MCTSCPRISDLDIDNFISTFPEKRNNQWCRQVVSQLWSDLKVTQKNNRVAELSVSDNEPTLEEFQKSVKKWHDDLLYMPSLDAITEHIHSNYIRKLHA